MKAVGIICEYNPLHLGHRRQIVKIREAFGPDTAVVCAMSGNFVQRGAPAIVDKSLRAKAALTCGADLVVELPITAALNSAEGFARGGVKVLRKLCDTLCFGSETADAGVLTDTASALLGPAFPPLLRQGLDRGLSFPAARQAALEALGLPGVKSPNDILGVEYCKAILESGTAMEIFPIHRPGDYHAEIPQEDSPSATAVRKLMLNRHNWRFCVPEAARKIFEGAALHSMAPGERAVLGKLRTMTDAEFAALPFGSEGLWRKLMHACRAENTLEDILTAAKSKRYTRSRLDRMVMCAFLGITAEAMAAPLPYARVLAFNDVGRGILSGVKKEGFFLNAGEAPDHPYWQLEQRAGDLYGLFAVDGPEAPGTEVRRRVSYERTL
ncbi:MAG: nucleotidyltransferase family protein [Eubacteriales bacterium]|nr:nucleotidyltransferase family protein [Eubacteriales bacterium]